MRLALAVAHIWQLRQLAQWTVEKKLRKKLASTFAYYRFKDRIIWQKASMVS